MRQLSRAEQKQRGCIDCTHCKSVSRKLAGTMEAMELLELEEDDDSEKNQRFRHCPFAVCPYHELDKYTDYKDYLKDVVHGNPDSITLRFLKQLGMA